MSSRSATLDQHTVLLNFKDTVISRPVGGGRLISIFENGGVGTYVSLSKDMLNLI